MSHAPLLLLVALLSGTVFGQATYYDPGLMERVWEARRGEITPCPECVGYAALLDEEDLGKQVWVTDGHEWVGPLLVIDCASPRHRAMLRSREWVIDLPWWLAQRWGMRGPIIVAVSDHEPYVEEPSDCASGRGLERDGC